MEFKEFTAGPDDSDRRLDRVIRKFVQQDSLSGIYKAIRKGLVKVNDKKTDASNHIFQGDVIKIAEFLLNRDDSAVIENNLKKPFPYEIILQTDDLLFINKPYDIAVHGSVDSLENIVAQWYKSSGLSSNSLSFKPGPLHRLDRKTTGLLAFSLSLKGARWFTENISTHCIAKKYNGIVEGIISEKQDWIDYISKDFDNDSSFQTVSISSEKNDGSKKAVTHVKPISSGSITGRPYTFVEFDIETGRTHQIRSQSALHGHPLAGDTAYNGKPISAKRDFFLHAAELVIPKENPLGLPEKIQCPIPADFKDFLSRLS